VLITRAVVAGEAGLSLLRLETRERQGAATRFYARVGFRWPQRIGVCGQYLGAAAGRLTLRKDRRELPVFLPAALVLVKSSKRPNKRMLETMKVASMGALLIKIPELWPWYLRSGELFGRLPEKPRMQLRNMRAFAGSLSFAARHWACRLR
jgi:hypothetical protein